MNNDHYAIAIGLTSYKGFTDPPADLLGPENDVDSISRWLSDPNGGGLPIENIKQIKSSDFKPPEPSDAPWPKHIEKHAFLWIDDKARKNMEAGRGRKVGRRLYLYMSGHGFSTPQRQACLLTADAGPDIINANIGASNWMNWWQDAGYFDEYVMLIDSCMNRMAQAVPTAAPMASLNAGFAPGPTFIAFAAKRPLKAIEIPIPEDGEKYHGAFTWAFLAGVRGAAANGLGTVTGESMANWLRAALYQRFPIADRINPEVSQEPEIVRNDPGLILARGVPHLTFEVEMRFPQEAIGHSANLWSQSPPSKLVVDIKSSVTLNLPVGLYVIEVPDVGYRHGFEVTKPCSVSVSVSGPPVQEHRAQAMFECEIDAGGEVNDVSVTATNHEMVESNRGKLLARLPYGVYRSRITSGHQFVDNVFVLDRDLLRPSADAEFGPESRVVPPMAASAVPYRLSHSETIDPALTSRLRSFPGPEAGSSQLGILASTDPRPNALRKQERWKDIRVVKANDEVLADFHSFPKTEVRSFSTGRAALMMFDVSPGTHFLRFAGEGGRPVELALTSAPDWRLETYIQRKPRTEDEETSRFSFLMCAASASRANAYVKSWDEISNDRFEKALIALADERPILNTQLEQLFVEKFTYPLEGILGGHLLLVQEEHRPTDKGLALLNEVVWNLRGMLGNEHPDVEALSLRCPAPELRRHRPFTAPPLYERSWRLMLEACEDNPRLIPSALWKRVLAPIAMPPYFAWSPDTETKSKYASALRAALRRETSTDMPRPVSQDVDAGEDAAFESTAFDQQGIRATREDLRRFARAYRIPLAAARAIKRH